MTTSNVSDADLVASLHELPTFLPWDHIRENVMPSILLTTLGMTCLYSLLFRITTSGSTTETKSSKEEEAKMTTFRLANLVINAVLGGIGIYYSHYTLPRDASAAERVTGLESDLYVLACVQMGYQLWSLGMGQWMIQEASSLMTYHHIAVLIVGGMSAFLTNGFRYHNPFFYGIIEISSVPLAMMNIFKDRPYLTQKYGTLYMVSRYAFMITFLSIRIYMFLPRQYDYLSLCWWLLSSSPSQPHQVFLLFCWISAVFLTLLQMFWAVLIIKGFIKAITKKSSKKLA